MTGRIPILDVEPVVACGRYPAKAVSGETFTVSATVFREGHGSVNADVVLCDPTGRERHPVRMRPGAPGTDRWHAEVTPDVVGEWTFLVQAWGDPVATWEHAASIKVPAGMDVELMFAEGALLLDRAVRQLPAAQPGERRLLEATAAALRDRSRPPAARLAVALAPEVADVLHRHPVRDLVTRSHPAPLLVERERALFSAWYEFFPRSEGAGTAPPRSGTLATAADRLPAIADMGFDVVYLPPIHPIGRAFRKGPNNALAAAGNDPGSPWAIGSAEGGHDAVHPELGTLADFDAFVRRASEYGLEVALDLALQVSPDHPWVSEHPEWFTVRADGSIAYAENPPKKYQDIYPLDFDTDPEGIYAEVLRILRHWMSHGVRIFRVDNPHTKPVDFWHRLLGEVRRSDPDVVFLAEAFTRPAMMRHLAQIGFQQSYTYFTWRNDKPGLEGYLNELAGDSAAYMRPNFFVNTPDILHAYLQYGGPAAFKIRAVLAALLSPSWGVYSGYELFEHVAVRPGSEEYLDSEKFQYRPRDYDEALRAGRSLAPYLTRLNGLRHAHPALRWLRNLRFHRIDSDEMIAFSKRRTLPDGGEDVVLAVVNLDPHGAREATVSLDLAALGLSNGETFAAHDELSGQTFRWGEHNYVRLDPAVEPAHVLTLRRWAR